MWARTSTVLAITISICSALQLEVIPPTTTTLQFCNRNKECIKQAFQTSVGSPRSRCYKEGDNLQGKSWFDAQEYCKSYGGRLPEIPDAITRKFFNENHGGLGYGYYWMGARYSRREDIWRWASGRAINDTDWMVDQPDREDAYIEPCMYYWQNSDTQHWGDDDCDGWRAYLCEIDDLDIIECMHWLEE